MAVPDFLLHGLIAHNGTCDELGEKAHIEGKIEEIPLYPHLIPVEVDHIGENLEGVKTDTDGQRDGADVDMKAQQAVDIFHQETQVFEHHEVAQQQHNAGRQHQLFSPRPGAKMLDQKARQPGRQRGRHHDEHISWFSPGVEQQRAHQQHRIAPWAAPDEKVQYDHQGKEKIEKRKLTKYHIAYPLIENSSMTK